MGDYTQVPTSPADPVATPSAQPDPPASDPNRPVSTIPADPLQTSSPVQSSPADPVDQVFEATASPEITPSVDPTSTATDSADLQPGVPISPQVSDTPAPTASPVPTEPQVLLPPTPPEALKESDIQHQPPPNQPSQVQPEAPKDAPVVHVETTPSQSAEIKSEPLDGTQNTPSADSKPPESPKTSFGDLSATVQPVPSAPPPVVMTPLQPSAPSAPQPQPTPPAEVPWSVSSFGALMDKPSDLSEAPALHIDPIEPPKKEPEVPISPQTPQPPLVDAVSLRQKSILARKQNREENLARIMELAQKKGIINNLDVRDFLHISQTTATEYLHTLVSSGKLKKEGSAKATKYFL